MLTVSTAILHGIDQMRNMPAADRRMAAENRAGFGQTAFICPNCGVKLRLASEKSRDLQIDPWLHEAVARILRGKD
jgi:predicted RNA-binding Zn-ribbon protein involved in translation (DUF1610 family)